MSTLRFAKKFTEVRKEIENSGSVNADFIKYPGKGDTTVRIIDEPEHWDSWWEHFDQGLSKSFPCTGERDTCPGCTSDNERTAKASRKVGMNCLSEHEGNFYVDYWKFGVSIVKKLEARAQRYGTACDRDYTIMRSGTGLQTEYDVEAEEKNPFDLSKYEPLRKSADTMLNQAYEEVFGEGSSGGPVAPKEESKAPTSTPVGNTDEGDPEIARLKAELAKARAPKEPEPVEESEIDRLRRELNEQLESRDAVKSEAPEGSARSRSGDPDDPPSEPEAVEESDASGEEPNVSMEDLQAMTKAQLLALATSEQKAGRLPDEAISSKTKSDLFEWIIDNL